MHLTKRFFLMNALAVLLSIALTALAVMIFVAAYTKLFGREAYFRDMKNAFEVRAAISEIKQEALADGFERLMNKNAQQELQDRLKPWGATAILLKNRDVLYSTNQWNPIDIEKGLLLSGGTTNQDTLELDGKTYIYARAEYKLPSGDQGVLLLFAPVKLQTSFYLVLGLFTFGFFILVFLLMNFWVSYRISQGIISPVSRLKDAAVRISEGDLSWEIAEEGEGGVRELSRTLELMRIKLKESIYLQQKYDDNRKFLVSSISHDLKTPVTSIIGYIQGIIDGIASTPEKMEAYLETARTKAVLVNAMIDDLLLYSKLDLNQLPYHFEKIDLARYVEDGVADYQYEYKQARLALEFRNELKGPVSVLIDRERLWRVLQNILVNAKSYMDKADGRVSVIVRETPTSAIIEIRDNGAGIPEVHLPHIFERFYRGDPSRSNAGGSGLGLAIAKQIVEGHDGKIWATSVVQEGTRFMISLKKL
ncbi:sensor histidine kinase [Paenibacillus cremeus]|uniref:histidine kinase n=1 Tax=Paenibacillus cremeus TaxID=2163881 RepID=A0A559K5J2_9BACL|nr:HAMP domain-containing sensor histidine kinase [Paenibacillus cremeus]TVY07367.1 HAMP domain-containing histidine kinase [Paenibacillus cremeus]